MATDSPACLITGVAGGVGGGLAEAFHEAGYFVIGTDRVECSSKNVDRFIRADLLQVVRNEQLAATFFSSLDECIGHRRLRVLVNNAALQVVARVEEIAVTDWDDTLAINVVAPFVLARQLLGRLEGGSIINVSSIHSRLTKKNFVAYATSKAALSGLTRALAVEIGDRVRVNAIEPAALDTQMLRQGFSGREHLLHELAAHHPTGSIGAPAEVGRLAVMMAGSSIPFLNGATISLDGGISSHLHDPA